MLHSSSVTRNRVARFFALALIVAGSLAAIPATAYAQAGAILASAGNNRVERDQQEINPTVPGTALRSGDTIYTGPIGRMQIRFVDGAIVSLQPRSVFRIDDYRFEQQDKRSFLSLLRGAMRTATGLIGKRDPKAYRLSTPSATVGIRGTHFTVEQTVCDPTCYPGKHEGMRVGVTRGRIVVANDAGSIELGANQAAFVAGPNSAPVGSESGPVLSPRQLQSPPSGPGLTTPLTEAGGDPVRSGPAIQPPSAPEASGQVAPRPGKAGAVNDRSDWSGDQQNPEQDPEQFTRWKQDPPSVRRDKRRANNDITQRLRDNFGDQWFIALPDQKHGGLDPELIAQAGDTANNGGGNTGAEGGQSGPDVTGPTSGLHDANRWRVLMAPVPLVSSASLVAGSKTTIAFDANTHLAALGRCPTGLCLSRGTAQSAEAGHDDYAAWGRWTNGTVSLSVAGLSRQVSIGPNAGLHYLIGVPPVSLPASGTFGYTLTGATAPTMSTGWYAPGSFKGEAAVQFGPGMKPRLGLDARVNMADGQFSFSTNGGASDPGNSQLTIGPDQTFSGDLHSSGSPGLRWMCASAGCEVRINGALMGPSAERLGVGYSIRSESGSTTIDGAAVFSRP